MHYFIRILMPIDLVTIREVAPLGNAPSYGFLPQTTTATISCGGKREKMGERRPLKGANHSQSNFRRSSEMSMWSPGFCGCEKNKVLHEKDKKKNGEMSVHRQFHEADLPNTAWCEFVCAKVGRYLLSE